MNPVGQSILETININLFNAEPTPQKMYQIYKELRYAGIEETETEIIFNKIQLFFKKRTTQNQGKLFTNIFHLHYSDHMRGLFSLSHKTSSVSYENLSNMACDLYRLLLPYEVEAYGVDERVLYLALLECFKPKYFEDEWRISLSRLFAKIKKVLVAKNQTEHLKKIEDLFLSLESSPLVPDKKILPVKTSGPLDSSLGDSKLTDSTKIKESEIEYIKNVLKSFEECTLPEELNDDLYPRPKRHPKVRQFHLLVKNYNSIIHNEEITLKDIFHELSFVAGSIQEVGNEICACMSGN